ncbi:hypothetical protein Y032_0001g90 [Ancylostoma ceylanicum]|uniref:Uncharacterized protein n=2 Tax=Ancylostoma ceylanicum TaxID=53326 RepID=A0A016W4B0_9BILA|nr:hypothetical protein Y032_0001g90 [Ancylostoma ceylanicum]
MVSSFARKTWPYHLRRVSRSLSAIGAMPNRSRIFSLRMRVLGVKPESFHQGKRPFKNHHHRKKESRSSSVVTVILISVVLVILITSAVVGVFVHQRRKKRNYTKSVEMLS